MAVKSPSSTCALLVNTSGDLKCKLLVFIFESVFIDHKNTQRERNATVAMSCTAWRRDGDIEVVSRQHKCKRFACGEKEGKFSGP